MLALQASACYHRPVDEMQQRILEAAYRVFVAGGFRAATTRRIADAAGVNEVTLFRRFASKEHLLAEAVDYATAQSLRVLQANPMPQIPGELRSELTTHLMATLQGLMRSEQAMRTSVGEWGQDPDLDERLLRTTNYVYDEFERYLGAAQDRGLIRGDVNVRVATEALLGTIFADGMLRGLLPKRFPLDPQGTVQTYVTIILDGLLVGEPATAKGD